MLPERLSRLMQLLARLPGVGEKTAQRFAQVVRKGLAVEDDCRDGHEREPCDHGELREETATRGG